MINTKLEKLFDKYNFSAKDRYEISQIFFLLTEDRKDKLLRNFDDFAFSVHKINRDIETEKDILIGDAVEQIKQSILNERKNNLDKYTKKQIKDLKGEI